MPATKTPRPYFKGLTDEALKAAYWDTRTLAANGAEVRSPGVGRLLADLDLIVAIARKRGLALR